MKRRLGPLFLALAAVGFAQKVEDFFDDKILHELRVEIHPKDWDKFIENYMDNTYYPAIVTWRNITMENVGIRSKGRTSRRPTKPGLRIDFNRYEEQDFLGLKAFLMDNNISDYSMLRERLSSVLWREMGLPAPRETHTKLFVNDRYMGVYTIAEDTDKTYLRRWFKNDEGWLYEYVHMEGYRFQYLGPETDKYVPMPFKPETNEKDPQPEVIEEMIRVINGASDGEFRQLVEEYVDVPKFLTHMALEAYLAEWDGVLSDAGINNIYFYRFPGKKQGMFLFKDKDLTFNLIDYPILKNSNDNVLMRRILAVPEWKAFLYSEILRAANLAGGEDGLLYREVEKAYEQIREAAYADALKECTTGPCPVWESNAEFERQVSYLRDFARKRPAEVVRQLGLMQ